MKIGKWEKLNIRGERVLMIFISSMLRKCPGRESEI